MISNRDEPPETPKFSLSKGFSFDWDIWLSKLFKKKRSYPDVRETKISNESDVDVLVALYKDPDEPDRSNPS